MTAPKIFVALDMPSTDQAHQLLRQLSPSLCGVKIGKELFTSAGPQFVQHCVEQGYAVFLDLKFHDIPNTVAKACMAAANLGVFMINIHIAGGRAMIEAARAAIDHESNKTKLIGVTVLTSLSNTDLREIGFQTTTQQLVSQWAKLGHDAGLDGIVCSAQEVASLRAKFPAPFLFVTPGIRLSANPQDDQKRVMTPVDALAAGSDYLVIGRPITQATHPLEVLESIQNDLICQVC